MPSNFFIASDQTSPPPELASISALKVYLNVSGEELFVIKKHHNKMYCHFKIPKRAGGFRSISAPDKRLLYLQRSLLEIFTRMHKPRNPVHGFVRQRSSITNAQEHLNRRYVLNIDLKDFFPSITKIRVSGLFTSLGIPSDVLDALISICCTNNCLPQGAPTSPVISNMISLRMDRQLMGYCKESCIKYSRYADDLTFSMYRRPNELFAESVPRPGKLKSNQISHKLKSIIEDNGFVLNEEKIRYFGVPSRKEVTGLIVSDIVNVPRKFVRNIRAIFFNIEKNTYDAAQVKFSKKTGKINPISEHLRGKITWISQIKGIYDSVYMGLAKRYNNLFPNKTLPIGNSKEEIRNLAIWVLEAGDTEYPMKTGTAFFLEDFGLVTASHCITKEKDNNKINENIKVFNYQKPSEKYKVSVDKHCSYQDLALLTHEIPDEKFINLKMQNKDVRRTEPVTILGFTEFGPGSSLHVTEARITALETKSSVKQLVVDGQINQGTSGGPIVDKFEYVVGVAHKGGPGETKQIAIAIKELKKL